MGIVYCYKGGSGTEEQIQWKVGRRCEIRHSHTFDMQCEHELKVDRKFLVEKFSKRWLQDHIFETHSLAYKHLQNNVQVSLLYCTDTLRNSSNTVPGNISDNEYTHKQSQTMTIAKMITVTILL